MIPLFLGFKFLTPRLDTQGGLEKYGELGYRRCRVYMGNLCIHLLSTLLSASGAHAIESIPAERLTSLSSQLEEQVLLRHQNCERNCNDRATIASDFLKKQKIKHRKIWVVGELNPTDQPGLKWPFHVAVLLKASDGEDYVIDAGFYSEPILLEAWLQRIGASDFKEIHQKDYYQDSSDQVYFYTKPSVSNPAEADTHHRQNAMIFAR